MTAARIPTRLIAALLTTTLFGVGCGGGSVSFLPEDGSVQPGQEVVLNAGAGVKFLGVDDEEIEAAQVILPPGRHLIEYRVRRSLRSEADYLDGVFEMGVCKFALDAQAGDTYLAYYTVERSTSETTSRISSNWRTLVQVENQATKETKTLGCELVYDCRRLKEGVQRHSMCASY